MIKSILNKYKNLESNSRIIIVNVVFSFLVKGGAMLISYLMMPAYLRFFREREPLGLWFTILAVLLFVFHFNLGIGNGLRNHLSSALAAEDYDRAKKLISSAYFFIGILSAFLTCFTFLLSKYLDLNVMFHIDTSIIPTRVLLLTIRIVLIGLMLNFIFGVINYIFFAMQYAFAPGLISLCTSVGMLLGVLLCPSGTASQNLLRMAYIHVVALNAPLIVATIIVFWRKLRRVAPSIKNVSWAYGKTLLKLGGAFFYIQIAYLIIMGINEYLISFFTGNENVVEYQIYNKLFILVGTLFAITLTPVWSVVTKAITEKKYVWVRSLYHKTSFLALFACVFEFVMIAFLQPIVNFWLKENTIQVGCFYSFVFAAFGSLIIYCQVLASFANGIGILKTQATIYTIGAVLKIPLSLILIRIFDSWVGVVLSTDLVFFVYCVAQFVTLRRYFLSFCSPTE